MTKVAPRDRLAGQSWQAEGYRRHAGFVADLGAPLLDLLEARPGERILDLGCGDGRLSARVHALGCHVIGLDASLDMVQAARVHGLAVVCADGHALPFADAFDAVLSNAALHWMPEPVRVVDAVRRALVPGGRFVAEMGGFANVAAICTALYAALEAEHLPQPERLPWVFPRPEAYAAMLEAGGLGVEQIALHPRPTPLPTDMSGWLATFAGPFLGDADAAARARVLERAERWLRPSLLADDGIWYADYVRLRFVARKPRA